MSHTVFSVVTRAILAFIIFVPLVLARPAGVERRGVGLASGHRIASDVDLLHCSWYYDWDVTSDPDPRYVPMSWSGGMVNLPSDYSGYLLVLNEPENPYQANQSPTEAAARVLALQAAFPNANLIIGGVGVWGGSWLLSFVAALGDYRPAGWHVHGYVESYLTPQDVIDFWDWARSVTPGGEFWITEFADTNGSGQELVNSLRGNPWVTRFAWFANRLDGTESWYPQNWANNPALISPSGQLTSYGLIYDY